MSAQWYFSQMVCERNLAPTVQRYCFGFSEYTWSNDEPVHHGYIIFSRSAETFLQSVEQEVGIGGHLAQRMPSGGSRTPGNEHRTIQQGVENSRTSAPYGVM